MAIRRVHREMAELRETCSRELGILPEQVQVFTPTPSTWSTLMYATGLDPWTLEPVYVERKLSGKERQKAMIAAHPGAGRPTRR